VLIQVAQEDVWPGRPASLRFAQREANLIRFAEAVAEIARRACGSVNVFGAPGLGLK